MLTTNYKKGGIPPKQKRRTCIVCGKEKILTKRCFEPLEFGGCFRKTCKLCEAKKPKPKQKWFQPSGSYTDEEIDAKAETIAPINPGIPIPPGCQWLTEADSIQEGDIVMGRLGWKEVHPGDKYIGAVVGAAYAVRPEKPVKRERDFVPGPTITRPHPGPHQRITIYPPRY